MKKSLVAALLVLSATTIFSLNAYIQQKHKADEYYEVASRMSDLIRCYDDHLTSDSLIEDYNCFEELKAIFLYDDGVGKPIELSDYVWGY